MKEQSLNSCEFDHETEGLLESNRPDLKNNFNPFNREANIKS